MGGLNHRATFHWVFTLEAKIAVVIFGVILLLMVFAFVQSAVRKRRGIQPWAKHKHYVVETASTVLTAMIAAALIAVSITANTSPPGGKPAVELRITGFQWCWRFSYQQTPVTVTDTCIDGHIPTAVLPVGERIRVQVTSLDVVHAAWVPYLRFKMYAYPDHINTFDTIIPKAGTYAGRCSEFCGLYHYAMHFSIRAVSPAAYHTWLTAQERRA